MAEAASLQPLIVVAAGGTGGHLFPAEALAVALKARGARVELATDDRAARYAGGFPAESIITFPAATPSGRSPIAAAKALLTLARGFFTARKRLAASRPAVVVGFGGYPTVPPLLAASTLKLPVVIHEQNAVLGRANAFLARRATAIATGFPEVGKVPDDVKSRITHVGNPVRPAIRQAALVPYPTFEAGGKLHLLVTGGSQGARVMSDIVPQAIALLPETLRSRLSVVQQARAEDIERVRGTYRDLGVDAVAESFFADLPDRMAAAHLMIGRAGASTVAELAVIGRPAILVPLPGSLDQDQAANAAVLERAGGATAVRQPDFTPQWLAGELEKRFNNPDSLRQTAQAASTAGHADAAERLAELVLDIAQRG